MLQFAQQESNAFIKEVTAPTKLHSRNHQTILSCSCVVQISWSCIGSVSNNNPIILIKRLQLLRNYSRTHQTILSCSCVVPISWSCIGSVSNNNPIILLHISSLSVYLLGYLQMGRPQNSFGMCSVLTLSSFRMIRIGLCCRVWYSFFLIRLYSVCTLQTCWFSVISFSSVEFSALLSDGKCNK